MCVARLITDIAALDNLVIATRLYWARVAKQCHLAGPGSPLWCPAWLNSRWDGSHRLMAAVEDLAFELQRDPGKFYFEDTLEGVPISWHFGEE